MQDTQKYSPLYHYFNKIFEVCLQKAEVKHVGITLRDYTFTHVAANF